jgi:hypothetical protein
MVVTDTATTVAGQLKRVPTAVRPTVNAARRMVKAIAPNATEIAYQGNPPRSKSAMWKLVRYSLGDEYVAGIGAFSTYAAIFFYRGRELDDGSGLLEGSGKDARFTRLRAPADAERPAVKRIARKAFALENAKKKQPQRGWHGAGDCSRRAGAPGTRHRGREAARGNAGEGARTERSP